MLFGPVAQLGERTVRIRKVESSILFGSTTSEQALYRLLRFFAGCEGLTLFAKTLKHFFRTRQTKKK